MILYKQTSLFVKRHGCTIVRIEKWTVRGPNHIVESLPLTGIPVKIGPLRDVVKKIYPPLIRRKDKGYAEI